MNGSVNQWHTQPEYCPQAAQTQYYYNAPNVSRTPCRWFGTEQGCKYGVYCQFPHIADQSHLIPMCQYDGHCPYGLSCKFRHSENYDALLRLHAQPSVNQSPSNIVSSIPSSYDDSPSYSMTSSLPVHPVPTVQVPIKNHIQSTQGLSRFELYV